MFGRCRRQLYRAGLGSLVVFSAMLSCSGATYIVAPDGAPAGDGSREKPFSVPHVFQTLDLKPGDEVVFRDGVYDLTDAKNAIILKAIGTETAPVLLRAENRHRAILDGGTPITGWAPEEKGVWRVTVKAAPRNLWVNGDGMIGAGSDWRRDGKNTLDEGMFVCEPVKEEGVVVRIHPWADREPKEVYALADRLMVMGGAFTVVDGLVFRRAGAAVHLAGQCVHVYKLNPGIYLDLSGLANHVYGSFNILRNCIARDTTNSALTSNESRFNLIEDCVVYNAGMGQGDHGIYVSQGAENLTLRRNVWWRISGGGIHIYSGTGIDSPRDMVIERNIFGPDKRNRCFPIKNRKSAAIYVWGGYRWAGNNRITHNLIFGPCDRGISLNKCNFNLVANNVFLNCDGAPIQIGSGFGNVVVNNIIEYGIGGEETEAVQKRPSGYVFFAFEDPAPVALSLFRNNLLLPRGDLGKEIPDFITHSRLAAADPFVGRQNFDLRIKPDAEAVDLGMVVPHLSGEVKGQGPDAGAIELGEEIQGEKSRFPEIPKWLLDEWPPSRRGE